MYFYWSNSIDYFVVEDLDIHNEKYKTILKNNLDRYEEEPVVEPMPTHENIRGGNYYQ